MMLVHIVLFGSMKRLVVQNTLRWCRIIHSVGETASLLHLAPLD